MSETGNSHDDSPPTIRIRPPKKWVPVDLRELGRTGNSSSPSHCVM